MARLTRHEILKEDQFLLTLEAVRDFFLKNRKQILLAISGAGFVALLGVGIFYYTARKDEKAKHELNQALKTYHSSVNTLVQGQTPVSSSEPSFKTSTEKYQKALAEFQKVSANYSSRPAGKIAKYYAGLCLTELNKNNEAIAILEPLSKEKSDYGVLAGVALALVYENSGNLGKATEIYRQIVDSGSPVSPRNVSLMHLAQLYEQQNKTSEATKIYQQVVKDSPSSPFSAEAEQKLKQISQ